PCVILGPLNPFEIRHGNASGVGQNIRKSEDFALSKNLIGFKCGWTIRAFSQDSAANPFGVCRRDLVLQGTRRENIALQFKQGGVGNRLAFREALEETSSGNMCEQRLHIESVFIVDAAAYVTDSDDFRSRG